MLDPDFIHKINSQEQALDAMKNIMDNFSKIAVPNSLQYMKLKQDIADVLDNLYAPR